MAARVEARPNLELAAPVTLSICCFRYAPEDVPNGPGREDYLNELNERIMTEMQDVPFRDGVWPKFLRDNALRVLGLASPATG